MTIMVSMEGMMNAGLKVSFALAVAAMMTVVVVAHREEDAGRQHRDEQAALLAVEPMKVTLYEGRACISPTGVYEERVLTNDDADPRLQDCKGGVTWKELRRE
jgi:hypothetical protein